LTRLKPRRSQLKIEYVFAGSSVGEIGHKLSLRNRGWTPIPRKAPSHGLVDTEGFARRMPIRGFEITSLKAAETADWANSRLRRTPHWRETSFQFQARD